DFHVTGVQTCALPILITFLLLATTIPIIATIFVSNHYTNKSLKERVAVENMNLLFQGANNLSTLLDNLNRASSNIYTIQSLIQEIGRASCREQAKYAM